MTAKLTVLDTERPKDIAANDVMARFAQFTEEMTVEIGRMSGFWFVVFDEQGNPSSSMYFGNNFPMPMPMVPHIVKELVNTDIYKSS